MGRFGAPARGAGGAGLAIPAVAVCRCGPAAGRRDASRVAGFARQRELRGLLRSDQWHLRGVRKNRREDFRAAARGYRRGVSRVAAGGADAYVLAFAAGGSRWPGGGRAAAQAAGGRADVR